VKKKEKGLTTEEAVSDRISSEEVMDDITALHKEGNASPLVFYGRVGSSYLISFPRKEGMYIGDVVPAFCARFGFSLLFLTLIQIFVFEVTRVQYEVKLILLFCTVCQLISYFLLFFIDPGTLFDDE
jgi:hypothetical protein